MFVDFQQDIIIGVNGSPFVVMASPAIFVPSTSIRETIVLQGSVMTTREVTGIVDDPE